MATLKKWLDEEGFNWEVGRIIYQPKAYYSSPGWSDSTGAEWITMAHPILIQEFDSGFEAVGPECPSIIAEDDEALYFPSQYDGSTSLEKVWKDLSKYLDFKSNEAPYPGGG